LGFYEEFATNSEQTNFEKKIYKKSQKTYKKDTLIINYHIFLSRAFGVNYLPQIFKEGFRKKSLKFF